jgi:hypothetical protein
MRESASRTCFCNFVSRARRAPVDALASTVSRLFRLYRISSTVSFEENLEGCARVWATRTCSYTDPSGPYTHTRHIYNIFEEPMVGRNRQPLHDLAESREPSNPQASRRTLSASAPWRCPWRPRAGSFAPCAALASLPWVPLLQASCFAALRTPGSRQSAV